VLSIYGESFFRGAIYGVQAMASSLFRLVITDVNVEDRTWVTDYVTSLEDQYSGTYIEPAIEAGKAFFGVGYNLFGILGTGAICALLLFSNWWLGGGSLWRGAIDCSAILVICTRLGFFGMGEIGLIGAVSWLFVSAKIWKVI
jgi:hypothetical protein